LGASTFLLKKITELISGEEVFEMLTGGGGGRKFLMFLLEKKKPPFEKA